MEHALPPGRAWVLGAVGICQRLVEPAARYEEICTRVERALPKEDSPTSPGVKLTGLATWGTNHLP